MNKQYALRPKWERNVNESTCSPGGRNTRVVQTSLPHLLRAPKEPHGISEAKNSRVYSGRPVRV